ncbi:MAG: hypothetical protein NZM40_01525 [Sphingomonadaceae bacterium]|uniref:hypothetical protein n=1 Tax=Thermaurantiacus sp. TaxID=2820283 RepID=UPI00298F3445|nr:hypothetical protein [Thermaurantiacus sp.]MCS6986122.1 hypothetical protein [Sphingomonadaceae bacterium]MDW8414654.1 hypothetical protein [Thermaurantiacus sp.]
MAGGPEHGEGSANDRAEGWPAVVLAGAAVLSAWASFQRGDWEGRKSDHLHLANAAPTRASELAISASQREAEHMGLFVAWLSAVAEGQVARARYLERQFRPPFDAEFARWRATLPADIAGGEIQVGRPAFVGLLSGAAERARATARAESEAANRAGANADRYDRSSVVLATALFLAGMAAVVRRLGAQRLMVALAGLLTLVSGVALLLMPVSFGG